LQGGSAVPRARSALCVARLLAALSLALVLALGGAGGPARAEESLQLEVFINEVPMQLIGAFVMLEDKHIASRQHELEDMGLNPKGHGEPDKLVTLDDLAGVSYRYDESTQRIYITAPDEMRISKEYDLSNQTRTELPPIQTAYGAVLNYDLFSSAANGQQKWLAFNGASGTFDARFFTPYGTLSQSAILQNTPAAPFTALRLNSTFTYSDYAAMRTYRVGDTINGGLAWTRPIRIGGLQVQRNFGLRSDLVTLPLPAARGTAAVPSTADIYINNVRTYSQDVGAGPYVLNNLPAITGNGTARVVLHDSSGRTTEAVLPFYASSMLLAPGLFDYSLEAGLPRLSFGTTGDTYLNRPVASASARFGVFDWLTVEGHAEGGAGLGNASAGFAARTGSFGVTSAAVAASYYASRVGYQSYVSYETRLLGLSINASSQMTFGSYDDLASVTARLQQQAIQTNPFDVSSFVDLSASVTQALDASMLISARPPKAFNRLSVSAPLPFARANLTGSFIQSVDAIGTRSDILSATLSGTWRDVSVFATAFHALTGVRNTGFLVGFSMPLGETATISTSVSGGAGGSNLSVDAAKPLDVKPGSIGWRIHDGEFGSSQRAAAVSYRSSFARTEASVYQDKSGVQGTAEIEGAVATLGGGVFFTNRIDDAFAVVSTGLPKVPVFFENRPVGETNGSGLALVTGLRSYQPNKIAIDATSLPVDADVTSNEIVVVPADRSGVKVDFTVKTDTRPAVVVFQGADGQPLAAGSQGQIEGGESFVVGYDGRAYIKSLAAANSATVTMLNGECHATFTYEPHPNEQVVIPGVVCK
jgi:outer membrane usher protein